MDFDKFDAYVKQDENNRELDDPSAVGVHENSGCADNYTIYLDINDDEVIQDSSYQTDGCPFGKASCEIATELVQGRSLDEVESMTTDDIEAAIDGYPPRRRTYPQQVLVAVRKALQDYDPDRAQPVDDPVEPLDDEIPEEVPQ